MAAQSEVDVVGPGFARVVPGRSDWPRWATWAVRNESTARRANSATGAPVSLARLLNASSWRDLKVRQVLSVDSRDIKWSSMIVVATGI
jgi:hypothetical protein